MTPVPNAMTSCGIERTKIRDFQILLCNELRETFAFPSHSKTRIAPTGSERRATLLASSPLGRASGGDVSRGFPFTSYFIKQRAWEEFLMVLRTVHFLVLGRQLTRSSRR